MKQYYLIGSPVAHSLSPAMMNLSFRLLGIDASYKLLDTREDELPARVEALIREGARGWNVTMPDKTAMAALCDELSLESRLCGAVNTVINENGRLTGHTTDGAGFLHALAGRGISLSGKNMVLFGSGGAAGIILIQSALSGAGSICVYCNRSESAARVTALAEKLAPYSSCHILIRSYRNRDLMEQDLADSAVLVNATNVGMDGGPAPGGCLLPEGIALPAGLFIYDIIYHPFRTPLIRRAEEAGLACESGLSMLIGQGAESFRIWTGQDMPVDEVRKALMGNPAYSSSF